MTEAAQDNAARRLAKSEARALAKVNRARAIRLARKRQKSLVGRAGRWLLSMFNLD